MVVNLLKRRTAHLQRVGIVNLLLEVWVADVEVDSAVDQLLEGHAAADADFLERLVLVLEYVDRSERCFVI